jgi:hypothetical protein
VKFKVSAKAVANAEAAVSFDLVEPEVGGPVPVKESTDKKGNLYKRWTEDAKIVAIEQSDKTVDNEKGKREHTVFYVRLQVDANSVLNKGRFVHARHNINPEALTTEEGPDVFTNERSIRALKSLFDALGVKLPNGEITEALLTTYFPQKGTLAKSPAEGKRVVVEMQGSNRSDGKGRQTQAEGYLPAKQTVAV